LGWLNADATNEAKAVQFAVMIHAPCRFRGIGLIIRHDPARTFQHCTNLRATDACGFGVAVGLTVERQQRPKLPLCILASHDG